MKKLKKIAYLILLIIVVVLSLFIYSNASKSGENDQKEKVLSEIKYVESKLLNLFNNMNNIEIKNYDISVSEITKQSSEESSTNQSSGGSSSQSGGQSGGSSEGQGESGAGSSGGESGAQGGGNQSSGGQASSGQAGSGETSGQKQETKKFELKSNSVLTKTQDINWENVKNEVENLYISLPNITIDLYQLNLNQETILSFNKEYDALITAVKNENKENTLVQLSKLYEHFPGFLKDSNQDELYTTLIEIKSNVFKGYSKLDGKNWEEISQDIKKAIDTNSKLLTNTNIDTSKQYNINKVYIMLNELQNASTEQDETVFLIKYKNLLEEINNI